LQWTKGYMSYGCLYTSYQNYRMPSIIFVSMHSEGG